MLPVLGDINGGMFSDWFAIPALILIFGPSICSIVIGILLIKKSIMEIIDGRRKTSNIILLIFGIILCFFGVLTFINLIF